MAEFYALILAGGKGERFWPYSTASNPKQLLSLIGGKPLVVQTVDRLAGVVSPDRIFVLTSEGIVNAVRSLLPDLPAAHVIAEPIGRNTAAAVAVGAGIVRARDPDGVMAILPSDHVIRDVERFRSVLAACFEAASKREVLVTIGIRPAGPSTGYGYIQAGPVEFVERDYAFLRAIRFVEKPDLERAKQFLNEGGYYWNAGMFVWSVSALERAFGRFRPDFAKLIRDVSVRADSSASLRALLAERYPRSENISVDYALMEKADNIVTVEGDFGWDDVGSWDSLAAHLSRDDNGNAALGDLVAVDAHGNVVVSEGKLTALLGVNDVVVVSTDKVTLVCRREDAERVREIVRLLRENDKWSKLL